MGGMAPGGRTHPAGPNAWHIGRRFGTNDGQNGPYVKNTRPNRFGQTAKSVFYQILSANHRKLWDGKATELRCVFLRFCNFSHYVGRVAISKPREIAGRKANTLGLYQCM